MKQIKVLGFNCAACRKATARIRDAIALHRADTTVEKLDDPRELLAYRVMKPPGGVVDAAWCIPAACQVGGGSRPA